MSAVMSVTGVASAAATPVRLAQVRCSSISTPVTYSGTAISMYGRLCTPLSAARGMTVLVHGATYNSVYWSGIGPSLDAQQQLGRSGWASLAIDRPGHGRSTRVPALAQTSTAEADTVHQVITGLRSGAIGGTRYRQIALMGHSLGSAISVIEAATHPRDIDRLVLSGWSHGLAPDVLVKVAAALTPVALDPGARSRLGLDLGGVTLRRDARQALLGSARESPVVAAADEATKDDFSPTELVDGLVEGISSLRTHSIHTPTLVVNGSADQAFCAGIGQVDCSSAASLKRGLEGDFSPDAHLATAILPGAGHDLQLDPEAPVYLSQVANWLNTAS